MEIHPISPTDVNWPFDLPDYRVYFWKKPVLTTPLPPNVREDQLVYSCSSYELRECHNVKDALAWAEENAGADRSFTLYATVVAGEKRRSPGCSELIRQGTRGIRK